MNKLIEIESEYGTILVESADEKEVITRSGERGGIGTIAKQKFEEALQAVKVVSNNIIGKADEFLNSPDEVNIKIGLKFTASAGVIVAKSSTEGNLEISITWKKKPN